MLLIMRYFCYATAVSGLLLASPPTAQAGENILLELNKVAQEGDSCRLHFLLTNETDTAFSNFRIQIAFFDRSGGFINNATADFLKVRPRKTILRFFDVPTLQCAELGEVLLNDAATCDAEDGPVADCVEMIAPAHRTETRFYK